MSVSVESQRGGGGGGRQARCAVVALLLSLQLQCHFNSAAGLAARPTTAGAGARRMAPFNMEGPKVGWQGNKENQGNQNEQTSLAPPAVQLADDLDADIIFLGTGW